jgi:dihydropteroate synthase
MLLRDLRALRVLGRPILLGASRKSTIGRVLDLPPAERLEGTLAVTALGIAGGADIVRVHDVAPNLRAARMADAIVRGTWQPPAGT